MRQITTATLADQNISSALLAATYTADADRALFIKVYLDQVAGGGDYVAYLTVQRLGAGSFYRVVPITTATVDAGVTSICFTTILFPVKNTDVVRVYVKGLAGDTTTPDIIVGIWEDDSLRPTTADRTLTVESDGMGHADLKEWLGVAPAAVTATSKYLQSAVQRWLTDDAAGTPDALSSGKIPADMKLWLAAAPAALTTSGYVQAMVLRWLTDNVGGTPDALSGGKLPSDVKLWLASAPAALTTSGYLQATLLRWLTDNAAGTPDALSGGKLPSDVKLWLASAPAALSTNGYLQAMLLRWLTDNAAGTPSALASNRVDSSVGAMAADVITAAAHDESTAFPLKLADTGATQVARTGADGDTLETLSDQVDLQALETTLTAIKGVGWTTETLVALDVLIDTINLKTTNLPASPAAIGSAMSLTAAAVDAILDEVVEGAYTMRQYLRLFAAMMLGKASGGGTATIIFRDTGDSTDRVTMTVDVNGNRSAVALVGT